jgi:hypothetical protein
MIPLPDKFRQGGFAFRVLHRRGRVALLVKQKHGQESESFEVVILRTLPERQAFGQTLPAGEYLPSSEAWGISGWTFTTRADAQNRFEREVERRERAAHCVHRSRKTAFSPPGNGRTADTRPRRVLRHSA